MHYAQQFCNDVQVFRNDAISLDAVGEFDKIILSPGPGLPKDAGIMPDVIARYGHNRPILGICLGLQGIIEHFGGKLHNMPEVVHGLQRKCIQIGYDAMFSGIPKEFMAGRYHSWAAKPDEVGNQLEVTSVDEHGWVMSARHKTLDVRGVQFHPESIMTPEGLKMMENWIVNDQRVE